MKKKNLYIYFLFNSSRCISEIGKFIPSIQAYQHLHIQVLWISGSHILKENENSSTTDGINTKVECYPQYTFGCWKDKD